MFRGQRGHSFHILWKSSQLLRERAGLCLRSQITERLELGGHSEDDLLFERASAKLYLGRIYFMKGVSGSELLNGGVPGWGGMGYSTGPRHSSTDHTNSQSRKQETLQTGFKKTKR